MVSGGATPPWSPKKAALICSKLAMMFLCGNHDSDGGARRPGRILQIHDVC